MKTLASAVVLALAAVGTAHAEIPYLSHGAGVYVGEDGRPVAAGAWPVAPGVPGIHSFPRLQPTPTAPQPPAPLPPAAPAPGPLPTPGPPPPADPAHVVDPALGGYYRDDLTRAAGTNVLCLTDGAWPASAPTSSTALWDGQKISMRLSRCEGLVPSKVGTELFARGLFVLAHESVHAGGQPDECEADKGAIQRMPSYAASLGFGEDAGAAARDLLLAIYRPAPLPPPYCLGRF